MQNPSTKNKILFKEKLNRNFNIHTHTHTFVCVPSDCLYKISYLNPF